jgi:hypothetical protein
MMDLSFSVKHTQNGALQNKPLANVQNLNLFSPVEITGKISRKLRMHIPDF